MQTKTRTEAIGSSDEVKLLNFSMFDFELAANETRQSFNELAFVWRDS